MATLRYVDVTGGSDGNGGTDPDTDAWQTLGYAANQVAADYHVYVKASASYTADDPDDATRNWVVDVAGTSTTPIVWEGFYSTPGDGGVVTVDAQSTNVNALQINISGNAYNVFKYFRFTDATDDGVDASAAEHVRWKFCRFDNNGASGADADSYGNFHGCVADNNTDIGIDDYIDGVLTCCIAHDNTNSGLVVIRGAMANCISYHNGDNVDTQISNNGNIYGTSLSIGCTTHGEDISGQRGIDVGSSSVTAVVLNCIMADCDTGLNANTSGVGELIISDHNLFYSNATADRSNIDAGDNDVSGTADPFEDSVSHDYRLPKDGEALKAGVDAEYTKKFWDSYADGVNPPTAGQGSYIDIGAMQREPSTTILGGILKATAFPNFPISLVQSSDGITPRTGGTVAVQRSIDGAAFTNVTNTPATEVGSGLYVIDLTATDLNGDTITLKCTDGSSVTKFITIKTRVE